MRAGGYAWVQRRTGPKGHTAVGYPPTWLVIFATSRIATGHGIQLEVVNHAEAKLGLVLLPGRWVVERNFTLAAEFW